MTAQHRLAAALVGLLALATSCGGTTAAGTSPPDTTSDEPAASAAPADAGAGIRVVSADDAAAIAEDPPTDLVILDVRTPEEFAEGHLDGAMMIDFYAEDFAEQLGALDPSVPYLLYCRSGNRSGQAAAIMADLGFADVADVDGGIIAWTDRGLPVTK